MANDQIPLTVREILLQVKWHSDTTQRNLLLQQAEATAMASLKASSGRELLYVAAAYVDEANPESARRCLDSAISHAGHVAEVYCDCARILLDLDDESAARKTLRKGEAALSGRDAINSTIGIVDNAQWLLLARSWAEDLVEFRRAKKLVDRCLENARHVHEYCSIAHVYSEVLQEAAAVLATMLTAEKAAKKSRDVTDWWTIAINYLQLNEEERARESLVSGTQMCASSADFATMAAAWHGFDASSFYLDVCLNGAFEHARSFEEWINAAKTHHECLADENGIRTALDNALAIAKEPNQMTTIAMCYNLYLTDSSTATSIGPSGLAPNDIAKPVTKLKGWVSDPAALLNWLRPKITDQIVESIASADYGIGFEENYTILQEICQTGLVPSPLPWYPLEVLELVRWQRGQSVEHVERAIACTLLCINDLATPRFCDEAKSIILLESCLALGQDAMSHLLGLMVALCEDSAFEEEEDSAEFKYPAAAIHGLFLTAGSIDPGDERLELLVKLLSIEGLEMLLSEGMRVDLWHRLTDKVVAAVIEANPKSQVLRYLHGYLENR